MARERTDESRDTYRRVLDLVRGGLTVRDAARVLSTELGVSEGAISQRYYVVAREQEPASGAAPPPRRVTAAAPRRRATDTPPNPLEVDVVSLLETAAAMIAEAAKGIRELERDAARWRRVRDVIDD